jgi:tRNA pseudouridine55 synthase
MLSGILNIDKPRGMSSHDVVAAVRRIVGHRVVGHTGTLDPDASGVLLLCLGRATKCAGAFEALDKSYWTVMRLGVCTDTQDATGTVTRRCEVPAIQAVQLQEVLEQFTGSITQLPPMYSAIKYRGRRLYQLARQGQVVPRQARQVVIHRLELLDIRGPLVTLSTTCTKGTYIRTLCEDIGLTLGYGAHVVHLQRCRVGHFGLGQACSLEQLQHEARAGSVERLCVPLSEALAFLPAFLLTPRQYDTLRTGQGRAAMLLGDTLHPQPTSSWYRLCTSMYKTVAVMYRQDASSQRWKVYDLQQDGASRAWAASG